MFTVAVLLGLAIAFALPLILTPRIVEYVETIDIKAPTQEVYDAIRKQRDLMRWSAWPTETGSNCTAEGPDGEVGAQTVFLDQKGRRFGFQEVTHLEHASRVSFKLESKGPPHVPTMDFYLTGSAEGSTKVLLHFRNTISPPFHVVLRLAGVVRWTRDMHKRDLDGLKRFIEQSQDYRGEALNAAA